MSKIRSPEAPVEPSTMSVVPSPRSWTARWCVWPASTSGTTPVSGSDIGGSWTIARSAPPASSMAAASRSPDCVSICCAYSLEGWLPLSGVNRGSATPANRSPATSWTSPSRITTWS